MTVPVPPYGQPDRPLDTQPPPATQPQMVRVRRPAVRPTVTFTILIITVLVFALQELTSSTPAARGPFLALGQMMFGTDLFNQLLAQGWASDLLTLLGAKISPLIVMGQYWRLITPVLLHASLVHIGFNMYALFAFGPSLESYYGHWRFLGLYLLGAIGGNTLSFLMNSSPAPSIGASTAIFGLVAAEGVFFYLNRHIFGAQARAALTNIAVVVVINLALGLSSSSIDNWGHMGGLLAGLVFAWFAGPRLEVTYNYPEYELADQRSSAMAWLVAAVLLAVIAGVVLLRMVSSTSG